MYRICIVPKNISRCTVVVPTFTPAFVVDRLESEYKAVVERFGSAWDDANERANEIVRGSLLCLSIVS